GRPCSTSSTVPASWSCSPRRATRSRRRPERATGAAVTRPIHGAALAIAAALLVLSGCGGDGSTTPSGESADAGTTSGPTDGGDTSGSAGCVGKKTAKLTLTPDEDTSLPGGGTAALESADLDAEP